jgi:hypothetical protein
MCVMPGKGLVVVAKTGRGFRYDVECGPRSSCIGLDWCFCQDMMSGKGVGVMFYLFRFAGAQEWLPCLGVA